MRKKLSMTVNGLCSRYISRPYVINGSTIYLENGEYSVKAKKKADRKRKS